MKRWLHDRTVGWLRCFFDDCKYSAVNYGTIDLDIENEDNHKSRIEINKQTCRARVIAHSIRKMQKWLDA